MDRGQILNHDNLNPIIGGVVELVYCEPYRPPKHRTVRPHELLIPV